MNNKILVLWGGGDSSCVFVYSRTKISVFYNCTFICLSGFHCGIIQESVDHIWVLHHFQNYKGEKKKKNILCKIQQKKKVFLQTCGHSKVRRTSSLPNLSSGERGPTRDWAWAVWLFHRCLLFWFVIAFVLSLWLMSFVLLKGHWPFTLFLFYFIFFQKWNTKQSLTMELLWK